MKDRGNHTRLSGDSASKRSLSQAGVAGPLPMRERPQPTYERKTQEGSRRVRANHSGLQGFANSELLIWMFQDLEGEEHCSNDGRKFPPFPKPKHEVAPQYSQTNSTIPCATMQSWLPSKLTLKLREASSKGILPRMSGVISTSSHFLTILN